SWLTMNEGPLAADTEDGFHVERQSGSESEIAMVGSAGIDRHRFQHHLFRGAPCKHADEHGRQPGFRHLVMRADASVDKAAAGLGVDCDFGNGPKPTSMRATA